MKKRKIDINDKSCFDILLNIFSFLIWKDQFNLRLVCQKYKDVIYSKLENRKYLLLLSSQDYEGQWDCYRNIILIFPASKKLEEFISKTSDIEIQDNFSHIYLEKSKTTYTLVKPYFKRNEFHTLKKCLPLVLNIDNYFEAMYIVKDEFDENDVHELFKSMYDDECGIIDCFDELCEKSNRV